MKKIIYIFFIFILLLSIGLGIWFYRNNNVKEESVSEIVATIGKMIDLPQEVPTLATVTDKSKLTGQPFFDKAENGDTVLIFANFGKAILYRSSLKKIIEVSTVSLVDNQAGIEKNETEVKKIDIKLALYNGTNISGLATDVEQRIFSQIEGIEVVAKKDAKNIFDKTLIVDISGKYREMVTGLITDLEAEESNIPDGEITPKADILIILGAKHP